MDSQVQGFSISTGNEHLELLDRLSNEISSARSALKEAENVLLERYALTKSNTFSTWKKRIT